MPVSYIYHLLNAATVINFFDLGPVNMEITATSVRPSSTVSHPTSDEHRDRRFHISSIRISYPSSRRHLWKDVNWKILDEVASACPYLRHVMVEVVTKEDKEAFIHDVARNMEHLSRANNLIFTYWDDDLDD